MPSTPALAADVYLTQYRALARVAAERARILYPGPVGEMLCRELHTYADLAFRVPTGITLIDRLIDHLLDPTRQVDRRGITHPGTERPGA